jgi:hypothetical protein
MSEFSRITGIFFEPSKTFQDITARPGWIIPLLLAVILTYASLFAFSQRIGWERAMRQRFETNTRMADLPAEQKERQIAAMSRVFTIWSYVGPPIGVSVVDLVISAVLLGVVAGMLSAPVKFKQVFAVVCYSGLITLISVPLTIAVMFLKNPDDFNMENPLMFNPGALMDPVSSSKFLYSLASSLDLFTFWMIFLIATGLKAAGGKRLSFGGALMAVILPWAIYILGKASFAGAFS